MNLQPKKSKPVVTVIVCTRDRPQLLENCLVALVRQTHPNFDILIVDNARLPQVRDICRRHGVEYCHEPVPGLSRARNTGARVARGAIVAYIDDDAIPNPDWLSALVRDFENPAVAAVTGQIRYVKACDRTRLMLSDDAPYEMAARSRNAFDQGTQAWFAKACFGGIGDGGNMAFRRDLIAGPAIFDERLGRGQTLDGGEEHVAFMSLISHGYRVTHTPEAVIRHPGPATPEQQRARHFNNLRSSIAYLMFLFAEFPTHRLEIVGFLLRAVARRLTGYGYTRKGRISRGLALRAIARGPFLYWKARGDWRRKAVSSRPLRATQVPGSLAHAPRGGGARSFE